MIRKHCREYLSLVEKNVPRRSLLRGCAEKGRIFVSEPRLDRRPRNMPLAVHRVADQWFFDHFGYRFRSQSYFCTGDDLIAAHYGAVYAVYPVDGFAFCWSPLVKDLHTEFLFKGISAENTSLITEILDQSGYICSNLHDAIDSGNEIMLIAEKFYNIKSK